MTAKQDGNADFTVVARKNSAPRCEKEQKGVLTRYLKRQTMENAKKKTKSKKGKD